MSPASVMRAEMRSVECTKRVYLSGVMESSSVGRVLHKLDTGSGHGVHTKCTTMLDRPNDGTFRATRPVYGEHEQPVPHLAAPGRRTPAAARRPGQRFARGRSVARAA